MGTMRLPVVDGDNANIDEAAALEMFDYAYKARHQLFRYGVGLSRRQRGSW